MARRRRMAVAHLIEVSAYRGYDYRQVLRLTARPDRVDGCVFGSDHDFARRYRTKDLQRIESRRLEEERNALWSWRKDGKASVHPRA
jgi:hypothetical protein